MMMQYRRIIAAALVLLLFGISPERAIAQGAGGGDNAAPQSKARPAAAKTLKPDKIDRPVAQKVVPPATTKPKADAVIAPPPPQQQPSSAAVKTAEPDPPAEPSIETKADTAIAPPPTQPPQPQLIIGSWGGGYGQAQDRAIVTPFAAHASIKVLRRAHGGAGNEMATPADVVDVSAATAARGCKSGALITLDDLELAPAPRGKPAGDDLLAGGRTKCGIASMAWSHVVLVNAKGFKKRIPKRLSHVFDIRRYPGRRAFVKQPRYLLEMALMADGARPGEVYALLDSYAGVKRALAKLASLWGNIIWLERPGDAYAVLTSGSAVIAAGFSGRAFRTVMANPGTSVIWDGQIYHVDYWAIPKATKNMEAARKFVRFATAPEQLAANARQFPYGPMRRSAVAMAGKHAMLGVELAPHLPTSPKNMRRALRHNTAWWAQNGAMMEARFARWLEMETEKRAKKQKRRRRSRRRRR